MAITLKVVNGDFQKDVMNKLKTETGSPLLSQHVMEELQNSIGMISDAVDARDGYIDFIIGLLSLRIQTRLDMLASILKLVNVQRTGEERIRNVDAINVKRGAADPRSISFWVRVISDAGVASTLTGG